MDAADVTQEGFLQTRNLVKRFDQVVAVDDVSLSIRQGEIFALLGSSGCGKSTLLRMLAGFETPSSGSMTLGGVDVGGQAPYERSVNMMFQSYALFPHLTVWDNIAFGLKREGMPKTALQARVDEMLGLVQLRDLAQRRPHQLSGGQQQRVALARSLAKRPKLLLLDEPLGALDRQLREQTRFELVNIIEKVGVTCVLVTHDQDEAMAMASRIAVMSHGKVVQVGTPTEIYEYPNCRFVADFIGSINLFEGRVTTADGALCEVSTALGGVRSARSIDASIGDLVSLAVRPEKVKISKTKPVFKPTFKPSPHSPASQNLFSGTLREIAYMGSYNSFVVESASGFLVKVTSTNTQHGAITNSNSGEAGDGFESHALTWGDSVYFWWDATATVLLVR